MLYRNRWLSTWSAGYLSCIGRLMFCPSCGYIRVIHYKIDPSLLSWYTSRCQTPKIITLANRYLSNHDLFPSVPQAPIGLVVPWPSEQFGRAFLPIMELRVRRFNLRQWKDQRNSFKSSTGWFHVRLPRDKTTLSLPLMWISKFTHTRHDAAHPTLIPRSIGWSAACCSPRKLDRTTWLAIDAPGWWMLINTASCILR